MRLPLLSVLLDRWSVISGRRPSRCRRWPGWRMAAWCHAAAPRPAILARSDDPKVRPGGTKLC